MFYSKVPDWSPSALPRQPFREVPGGWPERRGYCVSLLPSAGLTATCCPVTPLSWGSLLASLPSLQLLSTALGPGRRLLSMISLQLSLQESSRLLVGGRARCWLWQQVNKMCSQLGVSSWPGTGHGGKAASVPSAMWLFLLPLPNPRKVRCLAVAKEKRSNLEWCPCHQ